MNNSILFGFLLFIIYVLLPLIPAIIIYKIFPDTKVGASTVLGQLKVNATGAFAAYMVILTLGYFIIKDIQKHIDASNFDNSAWFVKSEVVLLTQGEDNTFIRCRRITEDSIVRKLDVKATPDYSQKNYSEVSFPMYYKNGYSRISFTYPGFESQVKTLTPDSVVFDYENRTINLGKVELKEMKQKYEEDAIVSNPSNSFTTLPTFSRTN